MSSVINSCQYLQHWVALSSILSIPRGISLYVLVYVYLCMIQSLAFSVIISGRLIRLVAFQRSLGFSPYCIPAFISPSTEICSSTLRPRQFRLLKKYCHTRFDLPLASPVSIGTFGEGIVYLEGQKCQIIIISYPLLFINLFLF
jgi:hypothetical protein